MGIPLVAAADAVGKNLHDHASMPNSRLVSVPTYNVRNNPLRLAGEGLAYLLKRRGMLTTCAVHALAHCRSKPDLEHPDIKLQLLPFWNDQAIRHHFAADTPIADASKRFGISISINLLEPGSRGEIRLRSADPADRPVIDFQLYGDSRDLECMRSGLKFANRIFAAEPLARFVSAPAYPPDPAQDDAAWDAQIRNCSQVSYHAAGTCRMGGNGDSVVDPRLRVRGVDGLRVADCSIMPIMPSANINAPAIMIGERGADFVLHDRR
jgi:choline dehydrogenase